MASVVGGGEEEVVVRAVLGVVYRVGYKPLAQTNRCKTSDITSGASI